MKREHKGGYRFYVHYVGANRRLDEWVREQQLDLSTVLIPQKVKKSAAQQSEISSSDSIPHDVSRWFFQISFFGQLLSSSSRLSTPERSLPSSSSFSRNLLTGSRKRRQAIIEYVDLKPEDSAQNGTGLIPIQQPSVSSSMGHYPGIVWCNIKCYIISISKGGFCNVAFISDSSGPGEGEMSLPLCVCGGKFTLYFYARLYKKPYIYDLPLHPKQISWDRYWFTNESGRGSCRISQSRKNVNSSKIVNIRCIYEDCPICFKISYDSRLLTFKFHYQNSL